MWQVGLSEPENLDDIIFVSTPPTYVEQIQFQRAYRGDNEAAFLLMLNRLDPSVPPHRLLRLYWEEVQELFPRCLEGIRIGTAMHRLSQLIDAPDAVVEYLPKVTPSPEPEPKQAQTPLQDIIAEIRARRLAQSTEEP